MRLASLLVAVSLSVTSIEAGAAELGEIAPGYTYYNRPGADAEAARLELEACIVDTSTPRELPGFSEGLAAIVIWAGPVAGLAAANVENCMISRGWRVIRLPDDVGAGMVGLSAEALAKRLELWIGAATPPGEIVRTFANEALAPASVTLASRPTPPNAHQLSFRAFKPTNLPAPHANEGFDALAGGRSGGPDLASTPPAGKAVVVVRVKGVSNRFGTGLVLAHDGMASPPMVARVGLMFAKKDNWFSFAVTPGRWRFAASGFLNFCLGSPYIELAAGDVVYAGTFDLAGERLGPEMTLEDARAWVGAAAIHIKPAVWRNGARGSCHVDGRIYSLRFPEVD